MKKIIQLICVFMMLNVLTSCGGKTVKLQECVNVEQNGIANHYGYVELYPSWEIIEQDIDTNKIKSFMDEKGITSDEIKLSSLVQIVASKSSDLSNEDTITIYAEPLDGVNATIEEISKAINVKFTSFEYTINGLADLKPIRFFKSGNNINFDGPSDYCIVTVNPGYVEGSTIYQSDDISVVYKGEQYASVIQNNRVVLTVYFDIESDSGDQFLFHTCGRQGSVSNGDTLTAFLSVSEGDGTFGYSGASRLSSEYGQQLLANLGYCAFETEKIITVDGLGEIISSKNWESNSDKVKQFLEGKKNNEVTITRSLLGVDGGVVYVPENYNNYVEYLEEVLRRKYCKSYLLVAKPESTVEDINEIAMAFGEDGDYEIDLTRNIYLDKDGNIQVFGRMGGYGESNDYVSKSWFSTVTPPLDDLINERYSNDYVIFPLD